MNEAQQCDNNVQVINSFSYSCHQHNTNNSVLKKLCFDKVLKTVDSFQIISVSLVSALLGFCWYCTNQCYAWLSMFVSVSSRCQCGDTCGDGGSVILDCDWSDLGQVIST